MFLILGIFLMVSCDSTYNLPGFDFTLFKNTSAWDLAKAVEKEDVEKINALLRGGSLDVDYRENRFGHTLLMLAVANDLEKSVTSLLENGADPNYLSADSSDNAMSIACNAIYTDECDTTILDRLIKRELWIRVT